MIIAQARGLKFRYNPQSSQFEPYNEDNDQVGDLLLDVAAAFGYLYTGNYLDDLEKGEYEFIKERWSNEASNPEGACR